MLILWFSLLTVHHSLLAGSKFQRAHERTRGAPGEMLLGCCVCDVEVGAGREVCATQLSDGTWPLAHSHSGQLTRPLLVLLITVANITTATAAATAPSATKPLLLLLLLITVANVTTAAAAAAAAAAAGFEDTLDRLFQA